MTEKSVATAATSPTNSNVVRKTRSFKRIRGFLTGGTRRRKKQEKKQQQRLDKEDKTAAVEPKKEEKKAQLLDDVTGDPVDNYQNDDSDDGESLGRASTVGEDASTMYGVDVDDRSLATTATSYNTESKKAVVEPSKQVQQAFLNNATPTKATTEGTDKENEKAKDVPPSAEVALPQPPAVNATDSNDSANTTNTANTNSPSLYMLKVVLLLMDPDTRRFELLQLEFDSRKALVSDVLAQIPLSVTEPALRKPLYTSICASDGMERYGPHSLRELCKVGNNNSSNNTVLVAVPSHVTARECCKLARPILNDEKVISMLLSSGIDARPWRVDPFKKRRGSNGGSKRRTASGDSSSTSGSRSVSSKAGSTSADAPPRTPQRSEPIKEESRNSDDGSDEKRTPRSKNKSNSSNNGNGSDSDEKAKSGTNSGRNGNTDTNDNNGTYHGENNDNGKTKFPYKRTLLTLIAAMIYGVHAYISSPIRPGQVVKPGMWLSKCGLWPWNCSPAYLHVGRDGNVLLYHAHQDAAWEMPGKPCEDNDNEECGLYVLADGGLEIGGQHVHNLYVFHNGPPLLSPWPFLEKPKIRRVHRRQYS